MNRSYLVMTLVPLCTMLNARADLIDKKTIKKYEKKILARVQDIQTGLSQAWASNILAGWSSMAASIISAIKEEPVTSLELRMFPMFKYFSDYQNFVNEFKQWLLKLSPAHVEKINTLLNEGKNKGCISADLFNEKILHINTIKRFFPQNSSFTVEELNKNLKVVDSADYKDEMFLRICCDLMYREEVLPTIANQNNV
jgi:hypothetical protein